MDSCSTPSKPPASPVNRPLNFPHMRRTKGQKKKAWQFGNAYIQEAAPLYVFHLAGSISGTMHPCSGPAAQFPFGKIVSNPPRPDHFWNVHCESFSLLHPGVVSKASPLENAHLPPPR